MITPVGTSSRRSGSQGRTDLKVAVTALLTGALTLAFSFVTYVFSDDHFGRITPGRQISRYGELPFRDFFDPGYFLTEFSSAAVQRLFGDNLLGEMLLTSSFVAAGAIVILLLISLAFLLLFDRKVWAAVQLRKGPNVVGPFGLLQSFADFFKFVFKEIVIPAGAVGSVKVRMSPPSGSDARTA